MAAIQQFAIAVGLKALGGAARGALEATRPAAAVAVAQTVGKGIAMDLAGSVLTGGIGKKTA